MLKRVEPSKTREKNKIQNLASIRGQHPPSYEYPFVSEKKVVRFYMITRMALNSAAKIDKKIDPLKVVAAPTG